MKEQYNALAVPNPSGTRNGKVRSLYETNHFFYTICRKARDFAKIKRALFSRLE